MDPTTNTEQTAEQQETDLSDSELAVALLKHKAVTEQQLKAAIDYQDSVGGHLEEILVKIGLLRATVLQDIIEKIRAGAALDDGSDRDSLEVDPEKLKVHTKLLDKLPPEVLERFGFLFFFPPPGTRAILVSSCQELDEGMLKKLKSVLGVDLHEIELAEEHRARFLEELSNKERGKKKSEVSDMKPASGVRPAVQSGDPMEQANTQMLQALVNLLIHKQIITEEDLQVEVELLKRRTEKA